MRTAASPRRRPSIPAIAIEFGSPEAAARNIAGLPAAARVLREAAVAGVDRATIVVPGGWRPDPRDQAELDRLAGAVAYDIAAAASPATLRITGERLPAADEIAAGGVTLSAPPPRQWAQRAGQRIIAATSKPGDGIVSRNINRPISQAISRVLLTFPAVRPWHATIGTALFGIAMFAALLAPGRYGLAIGALLFQGASIFDGVDGEIARATFRSSDAGAKADSLVDAATNLAFFAGLVLNHYLHGDWRSALAGALGLGIMIVGLSLIAARTRLNQGPFSFNLVKSRVGAERSRVMQWLVWLTMRDSFALLITVLILAGFAPHALLGFAVVAAGWLAVTLAVLYRQSA